MRILVLAAVAACGGPPAVHETTEAEPAWATDYAAAATRGCACTEDACIRAARVSLEATVDHHGGIEEAPPSVHQNRQKFEACWLATSRDLARDLGASADVICACTSSYCVDGWYADIGMLATKYGVADPDALRDSADAPALAAFERAATCLAKVTISSADYLAVLTTTNAELCACTMPECANAARAKTEAALDRYYAIGPDPALDQAIAAARLQQCKCGKKFPPTTDIDTEVNIGGTPVEITGTVTMGYTCPDQP